MPMAPAFVSITSIFLSGYLSLNSFEIFFAKSQVPDKTDENAKYIKSLPSSQCLSNVS